MHFFTKMKDTFEGINPNEHYKKAKDLYEKFPELEGKFLLGLRDWKGGEIKVVCDGSYQHELHYKSRENHGNLLESMGAEIKENPRSLKWEKN